MKRFAAVLLIIGYYGLWSAAAQSNIGKAITVQRSGLTIKIGRDDTNYLESRRAEILAVENVNIDTLIEKMISELLKAQATDRASAWIRREHKLWQKERSKHCYREARSDPKDRRALHELGCRGWAGRGRLEELLIRYDELAPR